ncbi:MAG: ABC transporter permease [Thermoflexibacter sp.]|jgi:lipoprotein-releasing system permease protein|nr:ABC transporter permease [Thermoflexibacter sp.]
MKSKQNISYLIAERISKSANGSAFSAIISKIAIGSIALGLATMIVSFMIFEGFQTEIRDKIFSFTAHFQITKYDAKESLENKPLSLSSKTYQKASSISEVLHIQSFSQKPALLKTDIEIMGTLIKGVGRDFDSVRFKKNIVEGDFISFNDSTHSNDLIISKHFANKLQLKLNDTIIVYFIQDPPRVRKVKIKGIYETGIEDFDQQIVLADNKLIQILNNWTDSLTGGYEIFLKDFSLLNEQTSDKVLDLMDFDMWLDSVTSHYAHFFEWFNMLHRNVIIFLSVIFFVACFNVVSVLLILIMERTNMIGSLKAFGASNSLIKRIFFLHGIKIVWKGIIIGNLLALAIGYVQYRFKLIPLDIETYYMSTVPIAWDVWNIIGLNLILVLIITLVLWIPTAIISRISPIKAIRFD